MFERRWRGFITFPTSMPTVSAVSRTMPVAGVTSTSATATHGAPLRTMTPMPRPPTGVEPLLERGRLGVHPYRRHEAGALRRAADRWRARPRLDRWQPSEKTSDHARVVLVRRVPVALERDQVAIGIEAGLHVGIPGRR